VPQRILVLGASGYIGQHLTAALSQQGTRCWRRHAHRTPAKAQFARRHLPQRRSQLAEGLPALLEGVDTLYYLVHSMGEGGDFIAHERQVAMNVRDALLQTPVKQVIFLSSLQAPERAVRSSARPPAHGDILRGAGSPSPNCGPGSSSAPVPPPSK
jgi:uncharacterized protein YbjT (DUF2867 family)